MKYPHIVQYVGDTLWAIHPAQLAELLSVLAFRAAGHEFTAEEIQARIGDPQPPRDARRGTVAVLPLRGMIAHRIGTMDDASGGMSAERFTRMVQQADADESVGPIVLDVDSLGGTVPGIQEAADAVYAARARHRVIAVANAKMASAAYWIASQAHEIVAIPSVYDRFIGSIGVFTVHQDLSAALDKAGVKTTLIKAGQHKVEGNPFEPLSDGLKAEIQASVDATYTAFLTAVARGRGVTVADVRAGFGEGRALNAVDAQKAGLIDRIATMDDTIGQLLAPQVPGGLPTDPRIQTATRASDAHWQNTIERALLELDL